MFSKITISTLFLLFLGHFKVVAFRYVPYEKNYFYYGISWHPDKIWHSFEYNIQSDRWGYFGKFKTIGINFQVADQVRCVGATMEKYLYRLNKKQSKFNRYVLPFVGLNPNFLKVNNKKAINIKPRIGVMLRSGYHFKHAGSPQFNLKLSYGVDIPFGHETIHVYNPHEFLVQLGISFVTRTGVLGGNQYSWVRIGKKKNRGERATF